MSAIPIVPGSTQVNTPTNGVKLDVGQLDQPNRARSSLGAVISDAGAEVGDFAIKLQGAVNFGIAADADRKMREASAEFQMSRAGRSDENNWDAEWKEKSDQLWANIQEEHPVGPSLKRQLSQNFKNWQVSNAIEVRTLANTQKINRAVQRVELAADEAAKDGDEEGINTVFAGAVENHLMLPEQAEKAKVQYGQKLQEYAAHNYITANPMGAVDFLEEKGKDGKPVNLTKLTPDQRFTLLSQARGAETKRRTEYQNDIATRRFSGEVVGDVELQAAVNERVVTAAWAKSFKKQQAHDLGLDGSSEQQTNEFGRLRTEALAYNPSQDSGDQYAKLFAQAQLLPEKMATDVINTLKQKADPRNPLNSAVATDAFQGIDKRFTLGLYGKYETKVEDADGNIKTVVNAKIFNDATALKRKVEDTARQYLAEHPNATGEEMERVVSNAQMSAVVRSGRQPLMNVLNPLMPAVNETTDQKNARLDAILGKAKKK